MRDMINRMMTSGLCALLAVPTVFGHTASAGADRSRHHAISEAHISNGQIRRGSISPDPESGFYRSTRFDWSGVIASLEYNGHQYYGPWFTGSDLAGARFRLPRADIVVSAQSGVVGPGRGVSAAAGIHHGETGGDVRQDRRRRAAQERRPAVQRYNTYEIVDPGKWSSRPRADAVEFSQEVNDPRSGYGYVSGRP